MPNGKSAGTLDTLTPKRWHRVAALLHRGRGQRRKTDDVADGIDVRRLGLVVLVDREPAAFVAGDPAFVEREALGRAAAADRIERLFGDDRLAALQVQPDPAPRP